MIQFTTSIVADAQGAIILYKKKKNSCVDCVGRDWIPARSCQGSVLENRTVTRSCLPARAQKITEQMYTYQKVSGTGMI